MSLGTATFNPSLESDTAAILARTEFVQALPQQKKWHYQPAVAGYTDKQQTLERLKCHAELAAPGLYAIGRSLASIFEGCIYEQRLKDDERIGQKSQDRYAGQPQCVLDYLAGRLRIGTLEHAEAVMDIFSQTGPIVLPNRLVVNVRDIKNKLTRCTESGLPVLAMKLDVPFWTEDGRREIHISELQFAPEQAFPLWDKSHAIYRKMRNQSAERTKLENRLGGVEVACLTPEWGKINGNVKRYAAERTRINLEARANVPWLDALRKARQGKDVLPAPVFVKELQLA